MQKRHLDLTCLKKFELHTFSTMDKTLVSAIFSCYSFEELKIGLLDGNPLLFLHELVQEKKEKFKETNWLPLTHQIGHRQFLLDMSDGSIHLQSGINI